jgi:phospholipid/cholesterol/gamma-HCH transport system substrate-binding protein
MTRNLLETLLGAIVLIVAVVFMVFAYKASQLSTDAGYELKARFDRVDGLQKGSDVRIGGIKVGTVVDQVLDPVSYQALVTFTVSDGIEVPADSSVAVASDGLLSGKYLSLVPGGDIAMLENGEEVTLTQSAINLEDLVGRFLFSQGSSGGGSKGGDAAGGADPLSETQ